MVQLGPIIAKLIASRKECNVEDHSFGGQLFVRSLVPPLYEHQDGLQNGMLVLAHTIYERKAPAMVFRCE